MNQQLLELVKEKGIVKMIIQDKEDMERRDRFRQGFLKWSKDGLMFRTLNDYCKTLTPRECGSITECIKSKGYKEYCDYFLRSI